MADDSPNNGLPLGTRLAELQARCEQQRKDLALHVESIENRLHGADVALGSIRAVLTKPSVLAGGIALLLTRGHSGLWPLLSRVAVLFSTGKRVYNLLKHK